MKLYKKNMNSLQELNDWVEKIKNLEVNENNIELLNNFIRTSPEKIADKLGIERVSLIKEFDIHKKEIHNKVIIYNRIKQLSNRKLEPFIFRYNAKSYQTKNCICIKYFSVKSNTKFYPSIKYLYCELEVFLLKKNLVVFTENKKVYITEEEFNENFMDLREYNINLIIN